MTLFPIVEKHKQKSILSIKILKFIRKKLLQLAHTKDTIDYGCIYNILEYIIAILPFKKTGSREK